MEQNSAQCGSVKTVEFRFKGDERGKLIALEGMSDAIPFDIKRIYYIFDTTSGTVWGKHAHKALKQVLICVSGACTINCELPDGTKSSYRLDWPDKGLQIDGLVWREMCDFSNGAVLVVLASEHYDEGDYIRNYEEFARMATQKGCR